MEERGAWIESRMGSMIESSDLRLTTLPLNNDGGHMPALGFGTLIADAMVTRTATRARENFAISALPEDAFDAINRIETRQRLNSVVQTGVPGFIPPGN